MHKLPENSVTRWFGEDFERLDPLLQDLHRYGGVLVGDVQILFGRSGIAKFLGKRLAKKLGIPLNNPQCPFKVEITHTCERLVWSRHFDTTIMTSIFEPVGHYPTGYWQELSNDLRLQLSVDIKQGAWHWVQQNMSWKGLKLPKQLVPTTTAYKKIDQGQYVFHVSLQHSKLGLLLAYTGRLSLENLPPWLKYPDTEIFWGGWRQGNSENWLLNIWLPFWERLTTSEKRAYLEKYPPPDNWQNWDVLSKAATHL